MLVTFSCDAYENITLFEHVAQRFLSMMEMSGSLPTAILAKDAPLALQRLENALKQMPISPKNADDDDDEVSLNKRAIPILALLRAAAKMHCDVMITA